MADRAENNKVPARNAPNSDQEPQRSRGPDDRPAPPHRDEMNRKTAPGRDSAAPSSPAPVANRITATESPTKKACNGLLQQNRHKADMPGCLLFVRFPARRAFRRCLETIMRGEVMKIVVIGGTGLIGSKVAEK